MKVSRASAPALLAALFTVLPVTMSAAESRPPRLVLQITVDALRADMPGRFSSHYGDGGWRYLLQQGLHYTSAYYEHANTETIVGHASLATRAYPADHGMVANVWLDREDGSLHYNIEDPAYVLLTAGGGVDAGREIDPTQRTARSEGRSPRAIRVSTFGDELASHSGGRAKVFSVSVKDRGAVSMAGHAGKAFWCTLSRRSKTSMKHWPAPFPASSSAWPSVKPPASAWSGRAVPTHP